MEKGLKGRNIVIGVTGSIACYKALDLIKEFRKKGANVYVIMTYGASQLVPVRDFEKAANEVRTHTFDPGIDYRNYIRKNKPMNHISFADIADLFLICPATANSIGKMAHGIADDLLTTSILATLAPVVIAPAMNVKMWNNAIVQENVQKLRKAGMLFIDPEYGDLACGYKGIGRLANTEKIGEYIETIALKRKTLEGKKIIVTAGATSEEIDPVRVITNKSSGKMGTYIAEEAFLRGADVTLIRGTNSVEPKIQMKDIKINTAKELFNEVKRNIKNADILIHAAAVSDFYVSRKKNGKIKSGQTLALELNPTTKILENIKKLNKKIKLVGFKAEYRVSEKELVKRAFSLLKDADANFIVANDVGKKGRGFDADTNEVFIVDKRGRAEHIGLRDKRVIAAKILDNIA
ncbi:bifunctional phosphopantothenoylcysteine decarboxylase/phosphopantothenate--cysteine ligase CoaBC [Candidatus Woesearchaeota archaeon]|nr:bifunctional phosphopantothenoylcysteine decarboxylase/phosphopantothenate--cysteine ligase CoaBC [Candidatus Woesearchaeota archaeon]